MTSTASIQAGILVESTFDDDDEGWTTGDFFASTGANTPTHLAAGGNPGGYIRTGDNFSWNAYQAPSSYLGDQSAAYGGLLHFDQQILSGSGNFAMVVISDGALILQFRTDAPGTTWTTYDIPLLASAGWEIANGSGIAGPAANEVQLLATLSSLSFLNISADWNDGPDQVDLDNVRLESVSAVPEPGSLALFGVGALGLIGAVRRRRRTA